MAGEQRYSSIWDALEDSPEAAEHLRIRSQLMREAQRLVRESGLNQTAAARQAGVTQPRMSDLVRGRISKFSSDALVDIIRAFGKRIEISFEEIEEPQTAAG